MLANSAPSKIPEKTSLIIRATQVINEAFIVLLALGAYYLAAGDRTTANKLAEWAYYALVSAAALALGEEVADLRKRRRDEANLGETLPH